MKRNRIKPEKGMVVTIPLTNDQFGLAIIIEVRELGESIYHTVWSFYDFMSPDKESLIKKLEDENYFRLPFLVCGMDYEELEKGKWPVIGKLDTHITNIDLSNPDILEKMMRESIAGVMLLEMYLGIQRWSLYKDPLYLDKRLLPGFKRSANILE
ncbi:Imm26 family immunity protein [Flavobacterium cerinum]|uniref:Uncharacterized protein n=1 Tax=Flavobacterium cerinum TaxID=2502784 RepID=A0A3S3U0T1_9FLAO|nr:Imm26 family immunity protein [Flavobacterium cerinum]RWX00591.1 hypothetical protein EPI11_09985 [Flavobacterium cerinum]